MDNINTTERKLMRDREGAWIAGVCAGLAKHLNVDVVLVRILVLALSILMGGIIVPAIYVIMAFALPAEPLRHGAVNNERRWLLWLITILLIIPIFLMIIFSFIALLTEAVGLI